MQAAERDAVRVLHILGDSRYGGIAGIVRGLGRTARAEGWQVDVLTTDPAVQEYLKSQSMGIVDLDVIHREIRPLWDLAGLFRLRRFLRRERYTVVHTHTSKAGFVGRLAAWLAGVPVVVHTMHGFAVHELSPRWAKAAYAALERLAAQWCHAIVSVSEFHRDWALALRICRPDRIQAIPNGIAPLPPAGAAGALRRSLGVREGEWLLVSVARLAGDKGLDYLIEAAGILNRREPRYRFLIAGEGPRREALEAQAHRLGVLGQVAFLGFRKDVADLLAAADLVVLPSLREGLSISLLEAMAAAKPIVATSIGSHREVSCGAEIARLAPPADAAALAQAIERTAADPEFMRRTAATAQDVFAAHYTEERMLEAYRKLYLTLLGRRSSVPEGAARSGGGTRVRSATAADLDGIVAIHRQAFSRFFLTELGPAFLRLYYGLVLQYGAGIVLVSESRGSLDGFVCGFVDPAEFYRLMWSRRPAFALAALAALSRRPWLAANVALAVRRIQSSAAQGAPLACELSSIAVKPEASGNGIGRSLLEAFLERSWSNRAQSVYLTTDAADNPAAQALYREAGFRQSRSFLQRKGRWMDEYVYHRVPPREPVENAL